MPNKYGPAAVEAAKSAQNLDPLEAWKIAMLRLYPDSPSSQKKGCPKGAFLGLCEEGVVKGVPLGSYTTSIDNKAYALRGYQILQAEKGPIRPGALWKKVMAGRKKTHNGQMDVVLALNGANLLD